MMFCDASAILYSPVRKEGEEQEPINRLLLDREEKQTQRSDS
jgi:hypothetical protein